MDQVESDLELERHSKVDYGKHDQIPCIKRYYLIACFRQELSESRGPQNLWQKKLCVSQTRDSVFLGYFLPGTSKKERRSIPVQS